MFNEIFKRWYGEFFGVLLGWALGFATACWLTFPSVRYVSHYLELVTWLEWVVGFFFLGLVLLLWVTLDVILVEVLG